MRIDGKNVILETKPCSCTWRGTPGLVAKTVPCPTCNGTGNGPKGGRNGCRKCHGFRTTYSETENVTCSGCNGTAIVPETTCDGMPAGAFEALQFKVYRQNRGESYNEHLLAHGCVYSMSGSGRSMQTPDADLIAEVKAHGARCQVCKVSEKQVMCDHVGIFVNLDGYSVRAVYNPDGSDAQAVLNRERGLMEGMAVGTRLSGLGLNGTMGAIYRRQSR